MGDMADDLMFQELMEELDEDARAEREYRWARNRECRERACLAMERGAEAVKRRWELQFLKNIVLKREV